MKRHLATVFLLLSLMHPHRLFADACHEAVQSYLNKKNSPLPHTPLTKINTVDDSATSVEIAWSAIINDCVDRIEGPSTHMPCTNAQSEYKEYKQSQGEVEFVLYTTLSNLEYMKASETDPLKIEMYEHLLNENQRDLSQTRAMQASLHAKVLQACVDSRLNLYER